MGWLGGRLVGRQVREVGSGGRGEDESEGGRACVSGYEAKNLMINE